MKICDNIKFYRIKKGFSQSDLAQKIGMSKQAVSMYERGEREPSIETLNKMCELFNVDMDTLCGRSNEKKPIDDELSKGLEMLIELFKQIPEESQPMVIEMIRAALKAQGLVED